MENLAGITDQLKDWKFYIASSKRFGNDCGELAQAIEDNSGVITRKWWKQYFKDKYPDMSDREFYSLPNVQTVRELDFKAIHDADIVIIVCNYPDKKAFDRLNGLKPKYTVDLEALSEHRKFLFEFIDGKYAGLTGALIEAGYAMALGKIVIFYGNMKKSAMVSGAIHCKTVEELWGVLGKVVTS